ncbi:COG3014 family protein [Ferruginibacter sp. HRS2-29]|uniref:COG3014 family protein n=1 Tax=Ferruginibacter sp. HRS2-29 TaxID=2487334 RepID=UPI0020CCCD9F|nr:hypothetical protein [Ferruginibacter sp. HRS2-29]MCP9752574.1 hypothetical protein [Ferruginibacter sp. HRS2-29]
MNFFIKRAYLILLLPVFFFSCATYNKSMDAYYSNIRSQQYDKALKNLESNKLIKRDRNQLLYFLEMGRTYRLKGDLENSNRYFNQADDYIEAARKSAKDVALSNLVNPMMQSYRGEDFEQFMLHYYKALNYAALGQTDEAVVEARRITLSTDAQEDKFKNPNKKYSKDAFALNVQGMIYEMAGDMNNAFISYRNAADTYLESGNGYYGVNMPAQLRQDLLRSAAAMGFTSDVERYGKLFNMAYTPQTSAAGELVLFLDEGQAPVKEERNFMLTTASGGLGNFTFLDQDGNSSNLPFDYNAYSISETRLSSVRAIRVAMPVYRVHYSNPVNKTITINGTAYTPELGQNLNSVAVNILKERFLTELTNALARQLTKKLVEKGAQSATEGIAKSKEKKSEKDEADEAKKEEKRKKREENAKAAGEIAGLLVNLVNTVTEKADTRNWQSLPAFVSYVRIPLNEGENIITVNANGINKTIKVIGKKGLQMEGINL